MVRGMMLRWAAVAAEAGLVRVGVGASTAIGCMSRSQYGVWISCSSRRAVRGGDGGKHAGTLAATCCLARRRPSPSTPTQVLSVVPTAGVPPSMSWQLGLPAAAGTLPTVGLAAWTSAVLIKTTTIRAGFPVSRLSAAAALSTAFLSFGPRRGVDLFLGVLAGDRRLRRCSDPELGDAGILPGARATLNKHDDAGQPCRNLNRMSNGVSVRTKNKGGTHHALGVLQSVLDRHHRLGCGLGRSGRELRRCGGGVRRGSLFGGVGTVVSLHPGAVPHCELLAVLGGCS